MFDVLNEFQKSALVFSPMMLVVPGVFFVLLGIVLWLAGTKFTKIIAVVPGFIGGATACFYLFPGHQPQAAITGAVVGGVLAMFVHRFIAVIAGSAIFAAAAIIFLVGTYFNEKAPNLSYQQQPSAMSIKLAPQQTVRLYRDRLMQVEDKLFRLSLELPVLTWPSFAAAVVVLGLIAMFSGRLAVAFACSSLGAALIFAGMFNLLLYKGAAPLTYVYGQISFYSAVFAFMVVGGTIVQMILCRQPKLAMLKREQEEEKEDKIKKNNHGEHKWTSPQS